MSISLTVIIFLVVVVVAVYGYKSGNKTDKVQDDANDEIPGEGIIRIHKIAGLGDEVRDTRTYPQACQSPLNYLAKRYKGILKFKLLDSDYKENNDASAFRRSFYKGGQYSCYFEGRYLANKILKTAIGAGGKMKYEEVYLPYPILQGFSAEIREVDGQKDMKQIVYTKADSRTLLNPTLLVQKYNNPANTLSGDIFLKNPNGVKYRIWDDHNQNENYLSDLINNLDTTVEFIVADSKVYQVTTANFIYSGILEKPILDFIISNFRR